MKYFVFIMLIAMGMVFSLPGCHKKSYDQTRYEKDHARNIRLPKTDSHYNKVSSFVEEEPNADYLHASEAAYEAFKDMKYGIRIHFGIYSILGQPGESWPYLRMNKEDKQHYQQLYQTFNPVGFNAEEWMELFKDVGLKCFAITTKHHEGFSMFDTKTKVKRRVNWMAPSGPAIESCDLAYSIMDTPFKRDTIKELCDAAHKWGIRIDLYFSHPDWYDADFRPYNYHPVQTEDVRLHTQDYGPLNMWERTVEKNAVLVMEPERTPEETDRLIQRHRTQILELLSNYGKIDMMCLDQWMGKDIWPQMRETIKMARKIQPDVMFRCRGIGNYGDYYTPEGFVPGDKENGNMPWMVIHTLGRSFSYEADSSQYKGAKWIIHNLVDAVAKGGNFMVGIGPDGTGRFHPAAIKQLQEAGAWLKINGEGIYATREREGYLWKQGDSVRFTRTKSNSCIYAISLNWPGKTLVLTSLKAKIGSEIQLLGYDKVLTWRNSNEGIEIEIPKELQNPNNRPNLLAYAFKIPQ
jgi:alpha-L-fucosidase